MRNFLVVGAGFAGAVYAREIAEAGHHVDVIDQRPHIGGNAYDYFDKHGVRIHKYGPHIFHTSNERVVEWMSQFTEWVEYKHKVLAKHTDNEYYVLPVNKETKHLIGEENVVDVFIRPYTKKMWGKDIEELNPKILERLLTLPHIPAYKEGIEKGIATYEKHKAILLNSKAKLQERKAKIAKIKAQEKSRDKDEKER